jgi:thioredoxin reductase (NADPH)
VNEAPLTVAVMCAAWCRTCDEFRPALDRLASARPGMRFLWIDIEDDEALCGELDIVDFPTLAVFDGAEPLHFGPSLPHEGVVGRLLDALLQRDDVQPADWPDAVRALGASLIERERR